MATYTDRYSLKKPSETDFVDIADINENMDKIDISLLSNEQKIKELEEKLETLPPSEPPTFEIGENGHLYAIYND